ncbi:pentapeptide repeat-containing protein [Paenibacillus thailandensis]|uniref:pentapeptide repeat-containing protein n=1 Tax=Paenibacillus thailandensis TaxID=393250 RepID=UPI00362BFEC8
MIDKHDTDRRAELTSDCSSCFGLCCTALPFAASADFAADKDAGQPCRHLRDDYRCAIHEGLRDKGYRGCTVYDCFGAGQKVSQLTFGGRDWRKHPESASRMFAVFPVMRQLHELLWYLNEALELEAAQPIREELALAYEETSRLTELAPEAIAAMDIPACRAQVNELLLKTSELVRREMRAISARPARSGRKIAERGADLIGAKLRGADLRGASLRGAYLIAADLRQADLRAADLIGADFRDADLRGGYTDILPGQDNILCSVNTQDTTPA